VRQGQDERCKIARKKQHGPLKASMNLLADHAAFNLGKGDGDMPLVRRAF
jgi:hypothetical protein